MESRTDEADRPQWGSVKVPPPRLSRGLGHQAHGLAGLVTEIPRNRILSHEKQAQTPNCTPRPVCAAGMYTRLEKPRQQARVSRRSKSVSPSSRFPETGHTPVGWRKGSGSCDYLGHRRHARAGKVRILPPPNPGTPKGNRWSGTRQHLDQFLQA